MKYLIAYDISESKLRSKVAKYLEGMAYRIQFSVFIGEFTDAEIISLKKHLSALTKKLDDRTLVVMPICKSCMDKIWHIGNFRENAPTFIIA